MDEERNRGFRMKKDITHTYSVPPELSSLLEKAAEFHGHLGPFLAIGIRMGLLGLKKMGKKKDDRITVDVSLPLHVPFSCIIDGIQFSTHCTIGNQKLSVNDSDSIQIKFKRENDRVQVTITLNKSIFKEIKSELLKEDMSEEEVQRLAWVIASIPEDKLFKML
jgi:formylmethanofuran dehydrogenase subunit E